MAPGRRCVRQSRCGVIQPVHVVDLRTVSLRQWQDRFRPPRECVRLSVRCLHRIGAAIGDGIPVEEHRRGRPLLWRLVRRRGGRPLLCPADARDGGPEHTVWTDDTVNYVYNDANPLRDRKLGKEKQMRMARMPSRRRRMPGSLGQMPAPSKAGTAGCQISVWPRPCAAPGASSSANATAKTMLASGHPVNVEERWAWPA